MGRAIINVRGKKKKKVAIHKSVLSFGIFLRYFFLCELLDNFTSLDLKEMFNENMKEVKRG